MTPVEQFLKISVFSPLCIHSYTQNYNLGTSIVITTKHHTAVRGVFTRLDHVTILTMNSSVLVLKLNHGIGPREDTCRILVQTCGVSCSHLTWQSSKYRLAETMLEASMVSREAIRLHTFNSRKHAHSHTDTTGTQTPYLLSVHNLRTVQNTRLLFRKKTTTEKQIRNNRTVMIVISFLELAFIFGMCCQKHPTGSCYLAH